MVFENHHHIFQLRNRPLLARVQQLCMGYFWLVFPGRNFAFPSRHTYVESTFNPRHGLTLFPHWYFVLFENESTSGFPRWFHVIFSTLIPRVFHVESTCFQRWINVMFSTLNQRQDPTWFPRWYLVLYESWFHVQFSTLNLRNVLNVEST